MRDKLVRKPNLSAGSAITKASRNGEIEEPSCDMCERSFACDELGEERVLGMRMICRMCCLPKFLNHRHGVTQGRRLEQRTT